MKGKIEQERIMDKGYSSGSFDGVWKFFTSVRLTVFILLALAVASAVGTFYPMMDMYHSWGFQFLICTLTVNIIVCSFERLSATWKIIFAVNPHFNASKFKDVQQRFEFTADCMPEKLKKNYENTIANKFGYHCIEDKDDGFYVFAEKGRWTRLGPYIVHMSIILLLIGSLIGSIFGFEGFINIPEGESRQEIELKNSDKIVKLDFAIRCDDFNISLYESNDADKSRIPSEYRSTLTILENDVPVLKKDVIVNDPLRYKGINLFQANYGTMPADIDSLKDKELTFNFTNSETGMVYVKRISVGKPVDMPEGAGTFIIKGFGDSYIFMGSRDLGEHIIGEIRPNNGEPVEVILPLRFSNFDKMRGGSFVISFAGGHQHRFYTGLQVTKDPGVFIVYAGFIIMIAGCFITFYMSHQRVCVTVTQSGEKSYIAVAGISNKNKMGMELRVKKLARQLAGAEKIG